MEALITGAVFVLIGWILWKAAKIAWALLLFGGAVIALLFWEGIKAYNAELAAIAAVAGALIGGWRYMKARL